LANVLPTKNPLFPSFSSVKNLLPKLGAPIGRQGYPELSGKSRKYAEMCGIWATAVLDANSPLCRHPNNHRDWA